MATTTTRSNTRKKMAMAFAMHRTTTAVKAGAKRLALGGKCILATWMMTAGSRENNER